MRSALAIALGLVSLALAPHARAEGAGFSSKPQAVKSGDRATVRFALSGPTDVEVAIVDAGGKVVRHLAAGVLGGAKPPPAPLMDGLAQVVEWDGKDDFGKPVAAAGLKARVRLGTGVKFGRFIGEDPYNFGKVVAAVADEDGNLYVMGFGGQLNQGHMCLRVFNKDGRYLREILPFPADLPPDAVKEVARWDEQAKAFRPINRRNQNVDFYDEPVSGRSHQPLTLVSASKTKGVVLARKGRTITLEPSGAVRGIQSANATPGEPANLAAFDSARAKAAPPGQRWTGPGERPIDWTRMEVDYARDEVYVNDGVACMFRYDGLTGQGGLLKKDAKTFYAADVAVGYDGLLYFRTCPGQSPGGEFSGPLERYTRDLAPANYPGGTHVLSKYIYGRYGIGYADRGIGVGPDGSAYISFMYGWVKYCTAGFGPDGRPLKGQYLQGQVGGKNYPEALTSAIVGPITAANGGVRVDLAGNLYLGLWAWPKGVPLPERFAKDEAYLCSTGSVFKFSPAGGMMTSPVADWSSDPVGSTPRTEGAPGIEARSGYRTPTRTYDVFVEGALAAYPGCGPFSHANWGENSCCVCRAPRFDVDRYGRIIMPNAISNSVQVLDNSGNVVLAFGKYGNFDSQYVPAGANGAKPLVATPDIPLGWPTAAGVSEKSIYVLDTYSRRVVRADLSFAVEESVEVK